MEVYPKRPAFFANKFVRLMGKVCAAQEVGPDAFTLLTIIAFTEDARGYKTPVTFFNDQLAAMCGFANVKALDRARRKAIEAGWLVYKVGGKHIPGRYFVTIPNVFNGTDDRPSDEGLHPDYLGEIDIVTGREAGDNREESGREAGDKREITGQHSSCTSPSPEPNPKTIAADAVGGSEDEIQKPKRTRKPDPIWDAIVEITGVDATVEGMAARIGKVKRAICKADPPYTAEEILRLPEVASVQMPWTAGRVLTLGEVQANIGLVRSKAKPVQKAPKQDGPVYKSQAELEEQWARDAAHLDSLRNLEWEAEQEELKRNAAKPEGDHG